MPYDPITFHPVTQKLLPAVPVVAVRSHIPGRDAVMESLIKLKMSLLLHNGSHTG